MKRLLRVALFLALAVPVVAFAAGRMAYVAGRQTIDLGGGSQFVQSAEGGQATAEVVHEKAGVDKVVRKHLTGIEYAPIEIQASIDTFLTQVRDFLRGDARRYNGTLNDLNFDNQVVRSRSFENATISEVAFPVLDGASKSPGYVTIKLNPERVRSQKAGGAAGVKGAGAAAKGGGGGFLPNNFRFDIEGLDGTKVSKVDAIVIKQSVRADALGEARDYGMQANPLQISHLKVTIPASGAESWIAWHEDFLVRGNNSADREKTGTITFLSANRQETLLTLELGGLGIFDLHQIEAEAGGDAVQRYEASLYVETIRIP